MKKLMFLTMMFGLMMVFSGSVSAQKAVFAVGSGGGTPKAGDVIRDAIHARTNNEPGAKAGTKYLAINFLAGGKGYGAAISQIPENQQKNWEVKKFGDRPITKVENPIAFRAYDELNIDYTTRGVIQVEVIRSKKSLGMMKIYYNEK